MLSTRCSYCHTTGIIAEYLANLPLLCKRCGKALIVDHEKLPTEAEPDSRVQHWPTAIRSADSAPVEPIELTRTPVAIQNKPRPGPFSSSDTPGVHKVFESNRPTPSRFNEMLYRNGQEGNPRNSATQVDITFGSVVAKRWQRLVARIIDCSIYLFIVTMIVSPVVFTRTLPIPTTFVFALMIIGVTLLIFRLVLLAMRGQDYGKWIMGLVITDDRTQPVGFVQAFLLRELPMLLMAFLVRYGMNMIRADVPEEFQIIFDILRGSVLYIIVGLSALWIFTSTQRCLHDRIAGTQVVVRPRSEPID